MTDETSGGHNAPLRDQSPPRERFAVAVVMRCVPVSGHPWLSERWEVIGVVPAEAGAPAQRARNARVDDETGERLVRFDGLSVQLYADEAESYYHNLTVETPRCFVVSRPGAAGQPIPVCVTASFELANAYVEADERVDAVPLPKELYPAIEAFVLTHYVPTERTKRRRQNWKPA